MAEEEKKNPSEEVKAEPEAPVAEEVKTEEPAAPAEEVKAEEPAAPAEEAKASEPAAPAEEAKASEPAAPAEEAKPVDGSTLKEEPEAAPKKETKKAETGATKAQVEAKIRKQIEKKQEKDANLGIYRIGEYLKEEHQWENWLFLFVSLVTLVLGCLMLNGALVVKEDFPLIGDYPTVFAWVLVGLASLGLLYALYPFFKPAFPEFKKITWLTGKKFLADTIRTFVFIIILTLLFMLYDMFITNILQLIM